jgi:hypothetical protein
VNEALEIGGAAARVHRVRVEIVLHDVGRGDQLGGERARHKVAIRIVIVARADVAVAVEHVLIHEDAVRGHEVLDELRVGRPGGRRWRLAAGGCRVKGGLHEGDRGAGHEPPSRDVHHRCPSPGTSCHPLIIHQE